MIKIFFKPIFCSLLKVPCQWTSLNQRLKRQSERKLEKPLKQSTSTRDFDDSVI